MVFVKKKTKIIIVIISSIVASLALAVGIPFIIFGVKSHEIDNSWSYLKEDATYSQKVEVTGLNLVTQHISCGYASIEMMSDYYGNKVTEDELSARNGGKVSTQTTDGFHKEISRSITTKSFASQFYLKNDHFLKTIHDALSRNNPVAIEWAALYEGQWTLHFSVVSSLDLSNDQVIVYNPYGYIETINVSKFINRTTFKAYTNLPFFLAFGFAYGAFHKNALFYAI